MKFRVDGFLVVIGLITNSPWLGAKMMYLFGSYNQRGNFYKVGKLEV